MKKLHLLALTLALTAACSGSADSTALPRNRGLGEPGKLVKSEAWKVCFWG